jgi:hypothetical protein
VNCGNQSCGAELDADHTVLVTTTHARHFCSVECLTASHDGHVAGLVDPGFKELVQRAICKLNREQDRDPNCMWHEIEVALRECGEQYGCDQEARWERDAVPGAG